MKKLALKIVYKTLKKLASKVINKHRPFVIAITGSVGKTTTKEAVSSVLKEGFENEVRASKANLNTEIGLPLTVLGLQKLPNKFIWPFFLIYAWLKSFSSKYPKYLVLEMGVDKPGDIDHFLSFVTPNISIVTALSPAHLANFKSLDEMQKEKLKIFELTNSNLIKIYNGDDEYFKKNPVPSGIGYGLNTSKECVAREVEVSFSGTSFSAIYGSNILKIKNKLIGKHQISSLLAAFCVAKILEIPNNKIINALNKLEPVNGRMRPLRGIEGISIIDDTYNSSPAAVKAAIETVSIIENKGKKVAILGNMNELGNYEKEAHKEVAKFIKDKVDLAVFVGSNADIMLKSHGGKNAMAFKNRSELISEIDNVVESGDLVLVKASQNGNYFEEVVKQMLSEELNPEEVLVRQSKFWLKKKGV